MNNRPSVSGAGIELDRRWLKLGIVSAAEASLRGAILNAQSGPHFAVMGTEVSGTYYEATKS